MCSSEVCGREYRSKNHLGEHRGTVHNGQTFKCADCPKEYYSDTGLRGHTRAICGKVFRTKTYLVKYVTNMHTVPNAEKAATFLSHILTNP